MCKRMRFCVPGSYAHALCVKILGRIIKNFAEEIHVSQTTQQITCTKLLIVQVSLLDYLNIFSIRLTLFVSMNFHHLLRYIECALATLCRCARSSAQVHLHLLCSPTHTCDVMDTRFCNLSLRLSLGKAESRQT